jgi:hypothetical protein
MNIQRPRSPLHILRFVALAATLLCSIPLVNSALFYKVALLNRGTVLDFAPNSGFLQPETTPVMAFTDYLKQKHTASPQSALGIGDIARGDTRRIRYDPVNPDNFRLDTPLGMWGASLLTLLYGLLPLLLIHALLSAQNKRPDRRNGPVNRLR